jgi:hypothetical protein
MGTQGRLRTTSATAFSRKNVADERLVVQTLSRELPAFRVTIDPKTAHDSYSAWRERNHDDLVLALALPCWYAGWGNKPWTAESLAKLAGRQA